MEKILIVDDDEQIAWHLAKFIEKLGLKHEYASNPQAALELMEKNEFDLVLLDIQFEGVNEGVDVLRAMNEQGIQIPVIVMSAYENVSVAVETTKLGAYDYLVKPLNEEKLRLTVANALKTKKLEHEVKALKKRLKAENEPEIIGNSREFAELVETARKIAGYDVSVLILGESGTGKEMIARTIHNNSLRKDGPFISIDCAALPDNLVESELFGHEKGAFTGAVESKPGRFEMADGGTLFLDEIGNLSVNVQKKLLRVIEERKLNRLGGKKTLDLDIRLITATNVDLKEAVTKGEFREDLLHRINEFHIEIPPLRSRGEDIILLANHFIKQYGAKFGKNVGGLTPEAEALFAAYQWPGNVRELENAVIHSVLLARDRIALKDLPKSITGGAKAKKEKAAHAIMPLKEAFGKIKNEVEMDLIVRALEASGGNMKRTAEALQIDYKTLFNKLKEYGITGK